MEDITTENTGPSVFPNETDLLAEVSKTIHELFLDTKDACFLCLKECASGCHQISLQGICRFLKIHPTSILISSLKESFDIGEEEVATLKETERNFSVIMCPSCVSLANHLSKLIKQLEIAKMLLAHKLQEFHTLLKISSSEPKENDATSRWKSVQEKMLKGCEDPVEVYLVEKLRLAATEKCSKKVATGSKYAPNVLLERLSPEIIEVQTRQPFPSNEGDFHDDAISVTSERSESTASQVDVLPENDSKKDFVWNLLNNSYKLLTSNDHPKQKLFQCLHCDYFCTRVPSGANIRQHIANSHVEKILFKVKPPLMPETDFRRICGELLISEKRQIKSLSNAPLKSCKYCECTYQKKRDLGYHLVLTHCVKLEENLQKRLHHLPKNQKICSFKKVPRKQAVPVQVPECGQAFKKAFFMLRHEHEGCSKAQKRRNVCNVKEGGSGKKGPSHLKRHQQNSGQLWAKRRNPKRKNENGRNQKSKVYKTRSSTANAKKKKNGKKIGPDFHVNPDESIVIEEVTEELGDIEMGPVLTDGLSENVSEIGKENEQKTVKVEMEEMDDVHVDKLEGMNVLMTCTTESVSMVKCEKEILEEVIDTHSSATGVPIVLVTQVEEEGNEGGMASTDMERRSVSSSPKEPVAGPSRRFVRRRRRRDGHRNKSAPSKLEYRCPRPNCLFKTSYFRSLKYHMAPSRYEKCPRLSTEEMYRRRKEKKKGYNAARYRK